MSVSAPAQACAHCGLPAGGGQDTEGNAFCCSGCFVAHGLAYGSDQDADRLLARVVLSAFLAMGVMVFSLSLYGEAWAPEDSVALTQAGQASEARLAVRGVVRMGALLLSLPVVFLLGLPLLRSVVSLRRWLSVEALVLCGAGTAWSVSVWNTFRERGDVYFDSATMVLVLVMLGRWLDVRCRERARGRLMARASEALDRASLWDEEQARERDVALEDVTPGDLVRVRCGELVPVDGVVEDGASFVDTASLSGEEQPRAVACGATVLAGMRVLDGTLLVRVEQGAGARLWDRIQELFDEARARPPRLVRQADRIVRIFLPSVILLAVATAIWHVPREGWEEGLVRAFCVLLIACPCALGIATPLAFWTALGEAWRRGVVVRGGDVLERLSRARKVFLDKTGTLTTGGFRLRTIEPRAEGLDEGEALRLAVALEAGSEHPIGRAFRELWRERGRDDRGLPRVSAFRAQPGIGVEAELDGRLHRLVRASESGAAGSANAGVDPGCTRLALEREGVLLAVFALEGTLRAEARAVVARLDRMELAPEILTGDGEGPARAVARELGIEARPELLPQDKLEVVNAAGPEGVVFVGDGRNDLAALAAADVGIVFPRGGRLAFAEADVALVRPELGRVVELLELSKRAVAVARVNLAWAFGYNALGLWLAVSGRLTPVFAAGAMVASSVFVVLHSARLRRSADRFFEPSETMGTHEVPLDRSGGTTEVADGGRELPLHEETWRAVHGPG